MRNTSGKLGKRVKARFGTPHLVAVVAGLATALLLLSWTRGQEQLVSVVVAAADIQAGDLVAAGDFRFIDIPLDSEVAPAIMAAIDPDLIVGTVAVRSISVGEPVLRSDVRPVATEDGLRAMSFPIAPANAVGGDLSIGDEVDVLIVGEVSTGRNSRNSRRSSMALDYL